MEKASDRTLVPSSRTALALTLMFTATGAAFAGGCRKDRGSDGGTDAAAPTDAAVNCTGKPAAARVVAGGADLIGGPMAIGLDGDLLLENDHLRVVIEGTGRNIAVNPYGGNIIDADVRRGTDPGRDALGEVGLLVNLVGTSDAAEVFVLQTGDGCAPAVVRARGTYVLSDYVNPTTTVSKVLPGSLMAGLDQLWALEVQVDYELGPDDEHVRLVTTLTATPAAAPDVPVALGYLIHAGQNDAFLPSSGGFAPPLFGALDFLRFEGDGVAYGLVPVTPGVLDRLVIAIAGGFAMFHEATTVELLGFPASAPLRLDAGDSATFETWFVVGETLSDVEREAARSRGVTPCVAAVVAVEEEGTAAPITGADVSAIALDGGGAEGNVLVHGRTDASGRAVLCLRPGSNVALIAGQAGRPYAGGGADPARVTFVVPDAPAGGGAPDVTLALPPTGALTATIRATDGSALPCRLTVLGVDPSPRTALLARDFGDPLAPGVVATRDSLDGDFALPLEPGDYDVVVTRGPEYSLLRVSVTVAPGTPAAVTGTLHHVLDTTGWISADLHVHAQMSPDSGTLNTERILNCAAEAVEVIVSTDQAFLTDYEPVIGDVGAEPWVASLVGEEVATPDYGHFNVFPLALDPLQHNRGANDWAGLDVESIVGLRPDVAPGMPGIVQINHPRAIPSPGLANYFTQIDLTFDMTGASVGPMAIDPVIVRLMPGAELLSAEFDALEIMTWANVQGLSDWFNFLNAGIVFTGTGNSDTHTRFVESSGWPRNYVFLGAGADDPATLAPGDLITALRAGASAVSFGPFLTAAARVAGAGPAGEVGLGATLDASAMGGAIEIVVRLQSADWIDVDRLDFYENGLLVRSEIVAPPLVPAGTTGEMRYELEFVHAATLAADAWYVIVATGTTPLWPGVVYNESNPTTLTLADVRADAVFAPLLPFAATNPVWLDVDGDGVITPSHVVLPEDWQTFRAEDRTAPY